MKIHLLSDYALGDVPLIAGQSAIVSDEDGAALIALGVAVALTEDERGGFSVPMPAETE
jgi:hypothetical protein